MALPQHLAYIALVLLLALILIDAATLSLAALSRTATDDDGFDFGIGAFKEDRVRADVFSVHFAGGAEVLIAITESDEAIAFTLSGAFIADDASLAYTGILAKSLEQAVIGDFASKIAHK